jgi:hypothetical protein
MASSRSSPAADGDARRHDPAAPNARADAGSAIAGNPVLDAIRRALVSFSAQRATADDRLRVAVALSGGRDSMTLLDALSILAPESGFALSALHVHHGLSPTPIAGPHSALTNARSAALR